MGKCLFFGVLLFSGVGANAWEITKDRWSNDDETRYSEFVQAIGESGCNQFDKCLKSSANPYRGTDSPGVHHYADCADFPYYLRAYFASKNGLPFSYIDQVRPLGKIGPAGIRYSIDGNYPYSRKSGIGSVTGTKFASNMINEVMSGTYRFHPQLFSEGFIPSGVTLKDNVHFTDFYPIEISRNSIKPGTIMYDPAGHVAVVYKVNDDGSIRLVQGHPRAVVSRVTFGADILTRSRPSHGAGFRNWRAQYLVDYDKNSDGQLIGGKIVASTDAESDYFSLEQYFGNVPAESGRWSEGKFSISNEEYTYHKYIRARLSLADYEIRPVLEFKKRIGEVCESINYRADSVAAAINDRIVSKAHPEKLPVNIYGTEGEWEDYSTPSRDARIKTAYITLYSEMKELLDRYFAGDDKIIYEGSDIKSDLESVFNESAPSCTVSYVNSSGESVTLNFEDVMNRLFTMSYDPYDCIELRWGATSASELSSCRQSETKMRWYRAQQFLRNQNMRLYDSKMDFNLSQLESDIAVGTPSEGAGIAEPLEVNFRKLFK